MERFGRPRFQGGASASKPYGARPRSSQNQSGMLRPSSRQSGGQYGSHQNSKPAQRSNNSSGSMMAGLRASSSGRKDDVAVPSEVRHLMETLGLSQSDMQKLSQLPEKDLSVNNLAKAIGNLKQGKQSSGNRPGSFSSTPNPTRRSESFQRGREESRGYRSNDGILGRAPSQELRPSFQGRASQRSPIGNRSLSSSGSRQPSGPRATVKPAIPPLMGTNTSRSRLSDPSPGSGFGDRREFSSKSQREEFQEEKRLYGRRRSAERPDTRPSSFSSISSRRSNESNFNAREVHANPAVQYGNERRVVRDREPQRQSSQSLRPVGTRSVSKGTVASTLPSLLDMPLGPKSRNTGSGILGNPPSSRTQGIDLLSAAVSGEPLLTPLMLATQTDPSVLEAQIQAMKVLQAQAIKMQSGSGPRDRERPMRRSPPPSARATLIERRMMETARKEAQTMRANKGRVLYIKYKSPRVLERDLRQLASAFGRVNKLFIIKPKITNGHFQAFMEMDSWDCAAAMLERYIAKPPNIKGCPIDVQRSNYSDLQPKIDQMRTTKRRRSVSPIRKGTTQLPSKRERKSDDKPSLSITTSRSERRVVSKPSEKSKNQDQKSVDAREILNRRNTQDKTESEERKISESDSKSEKKDENESSETKQDTEEEKAQTDAKKETDAEKNKEEFDPLDALADELALHDEFVLMDEVGYGRAKKIEEEDKKGGAMDLDGSELDLDDLRVEISREEEEEARRVKLKLDVPETEDDIVSSVLDEVIDAVMHQIEVSCQANLEEEMAALEEFNANEDEAHEYVYTDDSRAESIEDNIEHEQKENGNIQEDAPVPPEEEEAEDVLEDSSAATEVKLQMVLKEILEARDHLDTLVKVTKAKAAQACAKKLRVCLEVAISHLEGNEATDED